jgi:hypothetical protein
MYLELSRPAGDVSRWEKVFKRLNLLNTHYPFVDSKCSKIKALAIVQRRVSLDGSDVIQKNPKLAKLAKLAKLQNVPESVKQYAFVCRTNSFNGVHNRYEWVFRL